MTSNRNLQAKSIRDDLSEAVVSRFRPQLLLSQAHLRCLKCSNVLMPLPLSTDSAGNQTIWWVCKSVKDEKCDFPATMPPDVFWVTRTPEEKKRDFMPHPRIELLPEKYRHYYPSIFKPAQAPPSTRCTSTPDQAYVESSTSKIKDSSLKSTNSEAVMGPKLKMAGYGSSGSLGTSSGSGSSFKHPASKSSGSSSISSTESAVLEDDGNETSTSKIFRSSMGQRKATKRRRDRRGVSLGDVLAQEIDKLDYNMIRDEDLVKIAENIMEKVNGSMGRSTDDGWWHSFVVNQDYQQVAREVFASLDFQEAKRSAAKRVNADKVATIYSLRNARSGADLLAAIGAGTPAILPQSNSYKDTLRERLESIMKEVASRKKAIDDRLQIEVRGTARVRDAEESSSRKMSQRAGNSPKRPRLDHVAQQKTDKEHEDKAKQLVRGKITEVLEAKRQKEVTLVHFSSFTEPAVPMDVYATAVQPQIAAHLHPSASAPEFGFGDIIEDPIDFPMSSGGNPYASQIVYPPASSEAVHSMTEAMDQTSGSFRDTAYDEENFDNFFGGGDSLF